MLTYKLHHRQGSYYSTQVSPQIKAKNGINALSKAMAYAKTKFKDADIDKTDYRVVKNGSFFESDNERIHNRYCIGIDTFKENYIELELVPQKSC